MFCIDSPHGNVDIYVDKVSTRFNFQSKQSRSGDDLIVFDLIFSPGGLKVCQCVCRKDSPEPRIRFTVDGPFLVCWWLGCSESIQISPVGMKPGSNLLVYSKYILSKL